MTFIYLLLIWRATQSLSYIFSSDYLGVVRI